MSSKVLCSYLILYHLLNFREKKIDLEMHEMLFRSFKNVRICRHFGPPFAPVFPWFGISFDVD